MDRWLSRHSELVYALMRILAGVLFACHGFQKIFGAFGGTAKASGVLIFAAGIIESVCGSLVAIGLWAGHAAFISAGEMAVAYFLKHASMGFWPILNKGELAVLYCFVFLYIASKGSGALSVDALSRRRSRD
jgi:putative oxidoreductase